MSEYASQLNDIVKAVQGMAPFPPPAPRWRDLYLLGERFGELAERGPEDPLALNRASSELAYTLWHMALTANAAELIQHVVEFWAKCGPPGWMCAVRFLLFKVNKTNIETYRNMLDNLPETGRLLILNQLAGTHRIGDATFMQWAEDALANPKRRRPEDMLKFVLALDRAGSRPAAPVQEVLIREKFADWLGKHMESADRDEDFAEAARAAFIMPKMDFDRPLARGLASKSPARTAPALKAAASGAGRALCSKKTLDVIVSSPDDDSALMALEALMLMGVPKIDKAVAFVLNKRPHLKKRIFARFPLLNGPQYARVQEAVPEEDRREADLLVFAMLLEADPEWVLLFLADYLANVPRLYMLDEAGLKDTGAFLEEYGKKVADLPPMPEQAPPPKPPEKKQWNLTVGGLKSMFAKAPPSREQLKDKNVKKLVDGVDTYGLDLSGLNISNVTIVNRTLAYVKFTKTELTGGSFEDVVFKDCVFDGAFIKNSFFSNCRLERCTFKGTVFSEVIMQWMFVQGCTFTEAAFLSSLLTGLVCARSSLAKARFTQTQMERSTTRETSYADTVYEDAYFSSCRFEAADFSRASMVSTRFHGGEFTDCLFEDIRVVRSSLNRTRAMACHFSNAMGVEAASDEALFLDAFDQGVRSRLADADGLAERAEVPEWAGRDDCYEMILMLVDTWFMHRDMCARDTAFRLHNRTRLDRGVELLPESRRHFFRLLPHLFGSPLYELDEGLIEDENDTGRKKKTNKKQAPGNKTEPALISVDGYTPDYSTWELVQHYFKRYALEEPPESAPRACGLYLTGTFGSLIQSASVRAQIVVILDEEPPKAWLARFLVRLQGIEEWANRKFDMGVAFKVATAPDIKAGGFSFAGEHPSALDRRAGRREQFCRTHTVLAGKAPLWWLAPAELKSDEYDSFVDMFETLPYPWKSRYQDLGDLTGHEPPDMAGAGLARAADYLADIFDSQIRLGLARMLVDGGDETAADAAVLIKADVHARTPDLLATDPYMRPYLMVSAWAKKHYSPKEAAVLKLSMAQRAGVQQTGFDLSRPLAMPRRRALRRLFASELADRKEFLGKLGELTLDFTYLSKSGSIMANSVMHGFGKVVEASLSHPERLSMEPEPLDLLKRQITVTQAERKDKVARVPFLLPMDKFFQLMTIYAQKAAGRPTVWIARGVPAEVKVKKENMVDIARETDLALLLTWLTANGLYDPNCLVDTDYSTSPVTKQDVRRLLAKLHAFFSGGHDFESGLGYVKSPEIVTRAFFVLNLTSKKDVNTIFEASVVYQTSWGELFCNTSQIFGGKLAHDPYAFLKKTLPGKCPAKPAMDYFRPPKSRCPELPLGPAKDA